MLIICLIIIPGINGFMSHHNLEGGPMTQLHMINLSNCNDDECMDFWKNQYTEDFFTEIKIWTYLLTWGKVMDLSLNIRNSIESSFKINSYVNNFLGKGKIMDFTAWTIGTSTQATIIKAASDITGPILSKEKQLLKQYLIQTFNEDESESDSSIVRIYDFIGNHGKILSKKIWDIYSKNDDVTINLLALESMRFLSDFYLLPIFSEKCEEYVGEKILNGYIKNICVSLLSEGKDKALFEYAPSLYKEFNKKRLTAKDPYGNEYVSKFGEKSEDFINRLKITLEKTGREIRILCDGERCFDFSNEIHFDIMFAQYGGGGYHYYDTQRSDLNKKLDDLKYKIRTLEKVKNLDKYAKNKIKSKYQLEIFETRKKLLSINKNYVQGRLKKVKNLNKFNDLSDKAKKSKGEAWNHCKALKNDISRHDQNIQELKNMFNTISKNIGIFDQDSFEKDFHNVINEEKELHKMNDKFNQIRRNSINDEFIKYGNEAKKHYEQNEYIASERINEKQVKDILKFMKSNLKEKSEFTELEKAQNEKEHQIAYQEWMKRKIAKSNYIDKLNKNWLNKYAEDSETELRDQDTFWIKGRNGWGWRDMRARDKKVTTDPHKENPIRFFTETKPCKDFIGQSINCPLCEKRKQIKEANKKRVEALEKYVNQPRPPNSPPPKDLDKYGVKIVSNKRKHSNYGNKPTQIKRFRSSEDWNFHKRWSEKNNVM